MNDCAKLCWKWSIFLGLCKNTKIFFKHNSWNKHFVKLSRLDNVVTSVGTEPQVLEDRHNRQIVFVGCFLKTFDNYENTYDITPDLSLTEASYHTKNVFQELLNCFRASQHRNSLRFCIKNAPNGEKSADTLIYSQSTSVCLSSTPSCVTANHLYLVLLSAVYEVF